MKPIVGLSSAIIITLLSLVFSTPLQAISEYSPAANQGKANFSLMNCSGDSFWDPRNGGECWSCGGNIRSLFPVNSNKACRTKSRKLVSAAKRLANNQLFCPKDTFFDLRSGGKCWSCPKGTRRTLSAVTSNKACSRRITGKKAKATYVYDTGSIFKACKDDTFANLGSTKCYQCSKGYKHNPAKTVGKSGVCYVPAYTKHFVATEISDLSGIKCKAGFFDPTDGGSCWVCPSGYQRSITSVKKSNACVQLGLPEWGKAQFQNIQKINAKKVVAGAAKLGCGNYDSKAFFDLKQGGTCWICPESNPTRTLYSVDSNQACASNVCGKEDGRPCYVWERFPSCDKGLIENPFKNKCVEPQKLICRTFVKTIARLKSAIEKANAASGKIQGEALNHIPGLKQIDMFLKNQNAQVQEQIAKLTNKIDFSRVTSEFETLLVNNQDHLARMEAAALIMNNSKAALGRFFTDADLICSGDHKKIDDHLRAMGIADALGVKKKNPYAFNMTLISDAHATSANHKMTFDLMLDFPLAGVDASLGIQYATDFNGDSGVYFMHAISKEIKQKKDSFVSVIGGAFTLGWSHDSNNTLADINRDTCKGNVYSWGIPVKLFGPVGIGFNCSGFGGLALTIIGTDYGSILSIPSSTEKTPVAIPKKFSLKKPGIQGGGGYEGGITLWSTNASSPGIY